MKQFEKLEIAVRQAGGELVRNKKTGKRRYLLIFHYQKLNVDCANMQEIKDYLYKRGEL